MCDGQVGDKCNVETWLNYQGGTSNGFSPYDLVYSKVVSEDVSFRVDCKII